jgi:D-aminopeptidase
VATDAPLLPGGLERIARRAFLGLARAGSYASNGSGEIAIAFSTANRDCARRGAAPAVVRPEMVRSEALYSSLFAATTEAAEEAVINALLGARTLVGPRGTAHAFPVEQLPA